MAKLTAKQRKFVDEYVLSGNATQAAINAGYSQKTAKQAGTENLAKPYLAQEIKKRTEEIRTAKVATQQEVLEYLSSVLRGEQTESVATAKGVYTEVAVAAKDRIKAGELLGKRYAMWTENRNINANVGPVQLIDDIPGDDDDG